MYLKSFIIQIWKVHIFIRFGTILPIVLTKEKSKDVANILKESKKYIDIHSHAFWSNTENEGWLVCSRRNPRNISAEPLAFSKVECTRKWKMTSVLIIIPFELWFSYFVENLASHKKSGRKAYIWLKSV